VIDAIGELDTVSIYRAWYDKQGRARYRRLWRKLYPHSIGLFYSAMTQACGLKPMEEEYITMGMAAYGSKLYVEQMAQSLFRDIHEIEFIHNHHVGIDFELLATQSPSDLAACAQAITEYLVMNVAQRARKLVGSNNLVYGGGVALNCVANRELGRCFKRVWIMPNPGDAGSSLGAAALGMGRRVNWRTAYLGHVIPGEYPIAMVMDDLLTHGISAVASGAAEFGPRALGNRSLLADPRNAEIKSRVNAIKHRQQFRPFAPAILEEHVADYFVMPRAWTQSAYMQTVAHCRQPRQYPAIVHVDGTSRVQTVPNDGSGFRRLLETWHQATGCPMLLNTSLNIRGEPMVNDREDADRFQREYGVPVRS
jgi:carbamoyltransferase